MVKMVVSLNFHDISPIHRPSLELTALGQKRGMSIQLGGPLVSMTVHFDKRAIQLGSGVLSQDPPLLREETAFGFSL